MTVITNERNKKEVNDIGVTTDWTELLSVDTNESTMPVFFVWDNGGNEKSTALRFQWSYDGTKWCTSINGTGASIVMGAGSSVLMTPIDLTNDMYIPAPHIRLCAKKTTTRESMNASAYWPDNR